jgi:tetratricopeptide (TPR) repeat protein
MRATFIFISLIILNVSAFAQSESTFAKKLTDFTSKGKYSEAVMLLNEEICIDKTNPQLYFIKAILFEGLNNLDSAIIYYEKAISLRSTYFDAIYNLGVLYYNLGMDCFDKSIKAKHQECNKYFEKAMPFLENGLRIINTDSSCYVALKDIYIKLGNEPKLKELELLKKN